MKEALVQNIGTTFSELEKTVSSFPEEQINVIPFENSWTAGQVAEHIVKALGGAARTLNGKTEISDRDPGEKIKAINDLFLDFTTKMKSPDFILPGNESHTKNELLPAIDKLKKEILGLTDLDLSVLCLGFELPGFGKFTRLEWIHFFLAHTQRHTHQLKNIYSILNK